MTIIKRPQAVIDVIEQADYLSQVADPATADRFLEATETAFAELEQMPYIGSVYTTSQKNLAGLRQWHIKGFPRYIVFYLPTDIEIFIVRILHSSRDLDILFDE